MKWCKHLSIITVLAVIMMPTLLVAEDKKEPASVGFFLPRVSMRCAVTPELDPSYIPLSKIRRSSNLLRLPGQPQRAKGKYLHIKGRVVDEDCLPISNAIVQMWQTDRVGKIESQYQTSSPWELKDENFDPNFAFSGSAQTNNLGEFSFVTIFPGAAGPTEAPHLNVAVKHYGSVKYTQDDYGGFDDIQTRVYFHKHPRNSSDKALVALDETQRSLVLAKGQRIDPQNHFDGRVYYIEFTMRGVNRYRRY